jgi:hypothetical protein
MLQQITATVVLKSPEESDRAYGMVGDFLPDLENIIQAAHFFRDAGFMVSPYQNHLRLTGDTKLFESVFDVELQLNADVTCIGNICVPGPLRDVFVRIIFPEMLAQAAS